MVRQYVGARYVPLFYSGSNGTNWESGVEYEPLTVVTYMGNSYTSKKLVPATAGAPSEFPDYWAPTGTYNAQVESYRQEVQEVIQKTKNAVTPEQFGAAGDGIVDDTQAILSAVNSGHPIMGFGKYKISNSIYLPPNTYMILNEVYYTGTSYCFWTYRENIYCHIHTANGVAKGTGTLYYLRDPADDWTGGVCQSNVFAVDTAKNFECVFKAYSYTAHKGVQYCEFRFQAIELVDKAIWLECAAVARTWVNDIKVFGGQIGRGANHEVDYGLYAIVNGATSSEMGEISSCNFYNVTFEGCTVNCIKMRVCKGCNFYGMRLAEVSNTAETWVDMYRCEANVFQGYLNFPIRLIHDEEGSDITITKLRALRARNVFDFYNAQYRTSSYAGKIPMYSYNGQFASNANASGGNQAFITVNEGADLTTYDINGFFMDGFTVLTHGGTEITLPVIFGSLFNTIVIYITQGGTEAVTVKNFDGTTLKTLSGNGKHVLTWTQDKVVSYLSE